MSLRNEAARLCIAVPAAVELGLGGLHLAAAEVMPYHKEALGVDWNQLEPGVRTMLGALAQPKRSRE